MYGNSGNANPHQGRMAQALTRQASCEDDLEAARIALRRAVSRCAGLLEAENPDTICRASHALSQSSSALLRIVDAIELSGRVLALEERLHHVIRPRVVAKTA